jgi:type IV pilus assembly protein PilM
MFNLRSTYPIGIDLSDQSIYAVQLKETRQGLAVRGLAHREFELGDEGIFDTGDALISEIEEALNNRAFRGKRVVVHFPPENIISFPISFQVGEAETLEEAILREAEQHLPFPIAEAIIDYASIVSLPSGGANRYKASITTAHRDQMKKYLLMLKEAGLTVEAVEGGISCLIRLHRYLYEFDSNPIVLCNIGYTGSILSVVTGDGILVQRSLPWGIQILLRKVQENLEISRDRAKTIVKQYGILCNDGINLGDSMSRAINQMATTYLEELIHEFHNIIGYVISEEQDVVLERIYIYGQGSLIRYMDRYLEREVNIPTTLIINPMTKVELPEDNILSDVSEGASFALALGLAMRKVTWL